MAGKGGPKGNRNAAKSAETRAWSEAIRMAVKRRNKGRPGTLRDLADVFVDKVLEGDIAATREFGDRYEGKVPQAIEGTGDDGSFKFEIIAPWLQQTIANRNKG